jgi:hypothetical protein
MELNAEPVIQKAWRPYPKQAQFIAIPDSVFEALMGGAKGPGKTDTLIMLPLMRQFIEHPKFKALVLRRNFTDLEQEVIVRQREWYTPAGATYNESKHRWTWPSGAIIQNGHANKESDVRKYDSAEYNLIEWDESTHFTGFQYEYLSFTRCRSSAPDLPAIVRSGTNPGNVGHSYFRKRFVDPFRAGNQILRDKRTGLKRIFIPCGPRDNPTLLKNDPTYLQKLESLPEAEKRAAYGDWYTFSGQVFEEWRLEPLPGEPQNARHVIPGFNIPSWWPRILAIDWGFTAYTVAGWAAISPDGRVYLYRIHAVKNSLIKTWSVDIANLSKGENIVDAVICHSANQNRGEPQTIQLQVQIALADAGFEVGLRLGEKDRIGGKALVHEYLRWAPLPRVIPKEGYDHDLAIKLLRNYGEKKYKEYIQFFSEQEPETNLPKLQVFEYSPEGEPNDGLIDTIPDCIYQEKSVDGKLAEDVKEFDGDDFYDMLRMLLRRIDEYMATVKDEFLERKKIEEAYAMIQPGIDQTAFYRKMENIESQETGAVRMHKRRRR